MPTIPVRRWSSAGSALALAAALVAAVLVAPAGPARAAASAADPVDKYPRVIVEPTSASVPEGTGTSFRVRLSHPPAQASFLGMTAWGSGGWVSQPVMLQFTPTNWNNWQGYPLGNLQDPDTDDDVLVITLSFPGYRSATVTFTQIDDD